MACLAILAGRASCSTHCSTHCSTYSSSNSEDTGDTGARLLILRVRQQSDSLPSEAEADLPACV